MLIAMPQNEVLHKALENLKSNNVFIQEIAAEALLEMLKKPENVETLRSSIAEDLERDNKERLVSWVRLSRYRESAKVRRCMVVLLGKLRYKNLVTLFIGILRNDKDPGVREAAAAILGDVGGPQAEAALHRALAADPSELVKKAARISIEGLEIQRHVPSGRKAFGRAKSSKNKKITRRKIPIV